jgi:hypothetical protein
MEAGGCDDKNDWGSQVREKRQERHYEKRMAKAAKSTVKAKRTELQNEIHLLKAPHAQTKKLQMLERVPKQKEQKVVPMQTE